jgi:hypothetical protein
MKLRHVFVFFLSLIDMTTSTVRDEYNTYLHLFKKKETSNSFAIFTGNLQMITRANQQICETNHYYLTQDSDVIHGTYYTSPTIYIYVLNSRKRENQHTLLCV